MKVYLKDVFLGFNDGKKEAIYKEDFEKYFYDHDNIYEKATKPEKFIILGRKGSGKTILAEYIKKTSGTDPSHFCEIRFFKDFRFHELLALKSEDIKPNEYICIWKWVILLDLARNIISDQGCSNKDAQERLEKFYKKNYYSIDIDSQKVIELTRTNKFHGTLLGVGGEHSTNTTKERPQYLNYLEDLENTVFDSLTNTASQYTIIYDELDDRFRNNDDYKHSMISLIKATDEINTKMAQKTTNAKIILLMRSDIFGLFNDPDLNKISMVNALKIDWGNTVTEESPLFNLVLSRIKKSSQLLEKVRREELFNMFFPQWIKGIHPARFLLERTLFRPRDVITYLNYIMEKHPNTEYFGWKGFIETKKQYSKYFLEEIRNELSGHLEDEEIDKALLFFKQFNKHFFTYKEISNYFCKEHSRFGRLDLDKILETFFNFSIIGNKWFNEDRQKDFHTWKYRDPRAEIDFDKQFVIHLGLREELSM